MDRPFQKLLALSLLTQLLICASPASAGQRIEIGLPPMAGDAAMSGQIEWPSGHLADWNGYVLVFIAGGGRYDRDGWLAGTGKPEHPFRDLARELSRYGLAVVRFDNPGVRPPMMGCQRLVKQNRQISEGQIKGHCLDYQVLGGMTVERFVSSFARGMHELRKLMPRANFVLVGFSEGLLHGIELYQRHGIAFRAVVSIGSPAESAKSASKWQFTERVVEGVADFDLNKDGTTTNGEIESGYARGIGYFLSPIEYWFAPSGGKWDSKQLAVLRQRMWQSYSDGLSRYEKVQGPGALNWLETSSGIKLPDTTDSFWHLHFHGESSPAAVIARAGIPALMIWGENDRQLKVSRQTELVARYRQCGAPIESLVYDGRSHLLSRDIRPTWPERRFLPNLAYVIANFLSRINQASPKQSAAHVACPSGPSEK